MLDAATVPSACGGRKLADFPHAVELSEVTDRLFLALAKTLQQCYQRHGRKVEDPGPIILHESDSPDGPWTPVPRENMQSMVCGVGGAGGIDAALLAALVGAPAAAEGLGAQS